MKQQQNTISTSSLELPEGDAFRVNEMFYSIQGEGKLAGTPMVFLRFAECNLRCSLANSGFDCDTEFSAARTMSLAEIKAQAQILNPQRGWILLTGGEPALQVNDKLVEELHTAGWKIAIETNGTIPLPFGIDWICVSPKSAEHTLRQRRAHELKYVRRSGMALPEPRVKADHYLISPAFEADGSIKKETIDWCNKLVMENPTKWSLSVQYHKLIGVR